MQKRVIGYFDGLATSKTTFTTANVHTANVHTAKTNKVQPASQTEKTRVIGFYKARKIAIVLMLLVFSVFCAIGSADWIISQQVKINGETTSPGEAPSQSAFKIDESALQAHIEITAGASEATVQSKARANSASKAASNAANSASTATANAAPTASANAANSASNGATSNVSSSVYNGKALTVSLKNQPQNAAKNLVENASSVTFTTKYVTWNGTDSLTTGDFTAATDGMPTNAGKYAIYVQLKGYTGENGTINLGYAIKYYEITPRPVTITWVNTTFTYNGTAQQPTYTHTALCGSDKLNLKITQGDTAVTEAKNAGTYIATLSASANYALSNNTTEFTIAKKNVTIKWENTSFTYNGKAQIPTTTATGLLNGDTLNVSGAKTNAGEYKAEATASANYEITNPTQSFTINPYELIIEWSSTELTYNGEDNRNPTATIKNPISGITEPRIFLSLGVKNAGNDYKATATVRDSNYTIKSGCESTNFIIKKLDVTLTTIIEKDYDTNSPDGVLFDSSLITFDNDLAKGEIKVDLSGAKAQNFTSGTASETAGLFSYAYNQNEDVYIKAGSTYLISGVKFSDTNNFNITGVSNNTAKIYLKYKTASVGGKYYTIEDALAASGDITLAGDSTSPKSYVITAFSKLGLQDSSDFKDYKRDYSYSLSGKQLIVPYDNSGTIANYNKTDYKTGYVYAALVLHSNMNFTVSGDGTKLITAANIAYYNNTLTTAAMARGVIVNNGVITLSNKAKIESYGYIKGTGQITLEKGTTAVDAMSIYDWPGGTAASEMYESVFPTNAYTLHNISCKTRIDGGAYYTAKVYVYMSKFGIEKEVNVEQTIVGDSSIKGLFNLANSADNTSYIIKTASTSNNFDINNIASSNQDCSKPIKHRDVIETYGNYIDNSISITIEVPIIKDPVLKNDLTKPLPIGLMDVTIASGSLTLQASDYTILPGATITVAEQGTLVLGSGVDLVGMPISEMPTNGNPSGNDNNKSYYTYCNYTTDGKIVINGRLTGTGNLGGKFLTEVEGATLTIANNSATYKTLCSTNSPYYKSGTLSATGGYYNRVGYTRRK